MADAVVFLVLLIAALWVGSLFTQPQMRCTRCTGAAPQLRPVRARAPRTCPGCRGTGTRERAGVAVLRMLGWDIGPTGRLRRGAITAGTGHGPGHHRPGR